MKTRLSFGQIDFMFLNPFNGIDVEVPDELWQTYRQACNQLSLIQEELRRILTPQCEAADERYDRWQAREGLSIHCGKLGEPN